MHGSHHCSPWRTFMEGFHYFSANATQHYSNKDDFYVFETLCIQFMNNVTKDLHGKFDRFDYTFKSCTGSCNNLYIKLNAPRRGKNGYINTFGIKFELVAHGRYSKTTIKSKHSVIWSIYTRIMAADNSQNQNFKASNAVNTSSIPNLNEVYANTTL